MNSFVVTTTTQTHIPALQSILQETELFPPDMLPDMVGAVLSGGQVGLWLTLAIAEGPVGFAYSVPEAMTNGTWNMLALAVDPARQGAGFGAALVAETEARLRSQGHRLVIVDTSGTDDFAGTRAFYAINGFTQEARIRDFWAAGDDKVVFVKPLSPD